MSLDIDTFQLICLIFFLLVFIGRTLYLRVARGIKVLVLGQDKKGVQAIVEISFFMGLVLWMVEIFFYSTPSNRRIFPAPLDIQIVDTFALKVIGAILVVASLLIFVLALYALNQSWRVGIDHNSPGELITTGIFVYSRNPIFVFVDMYSWGTFLINGSLIFLIFAVLILIGLHYQILQEEKFLSAKYGHAYEEYCQKTARYFGRPE